MSQRSLWPGPHPASTTMWNLAALSLLLSAGAVPGSDGAGETASAPPARPGATAGFNGKSDAASGAPFRLENSAIAVMVDRGSGAITAIENKRTGAKTSIDDAGFAVEVGAEATPGTLGLLTPRNCELRDASGAAAATRHVFTRGSLTLTLSYRLDPEDEFVLKRLRLDYSGPGRFNVSRLVMFDWALKPRPARSIPYYGFLKPSVTRDLDDGEPALPSDTSTAFFHRYGEDGVFTALSCDFVLMQEDPETSRSRSIYWPGLILEAGKPFESEWGIVGVYQRKGLFHAPYQSQDRLGDFHFPNVDTRLDRGEIEGMSAAVRKFIKPGVYYTLVNGWGVGLPRIIETEEHAAICEREIDTLTRIPALQGLHFVHSWCGLVREFREFGLKMPLTPNPFAERVFQYAKDKGLGLSMFIGISNNYPLQGEEGGPLVGSRELLSLDAEGKRRPGNIAISRQYADFICATVSALRGKYPVEGLTFDFLSLQPDYDVEHGYLPGRASLYPQYAFLRGINRTLRDRFPGLMLRGQVGWMWLGPWLAENMSLCHNSHDHGCANLRNFLDFHVDYQFANNIRLSNWFTNNCKMHPRHKMNSNSIHNGSQFRAWDYGAWEYAILSQIATSQVFGMIHNLPDEQNGEVFRKEDARFFEKWIAWHKSHAEYYLRENDLFGEPRPTGIDGYAYGNGEDSILFLCNPTFQSRVAAVPLNREIHLPEGRSYAVKELYPEERCRVGPNDGVFPYGASFVTRVPPQTVMVFEIKPDDPAKPLLLGIEGEIKLRGDGELSIASASGPPGAERLVAVRLPPGAKGTEHVELNGQALPMTRVAGLLLGRVRFDGDPIEPEVRDWKCERMGERLKVHARFFVPEAARGILQSQALPVSAAFDNEESLNRAAWLGWQRFIIHLPIVPTGFEADDLRGPQADRVEQTAPAEATLNGKAVAVHSNIMGKETGNRRWSGFFIDATREVEYGKVNRLELDLYKAPEDQFFGIYLPNLTRQKTASVKALPAPETLAMDDAPEAADAFIPVPRIVTNGDRLKVYLRLSLKARGTNAMNPAEDVAVEKGAISSIAVIGADPRWTIDENLARQGCIALGSKTKQIQLEIDGTRDTRIRLGSGEGACEFSLGAVLDAWNKRGDRFDPFAATLQWPAKRATVDVDLIDSWSHKRAVREDL